MTTNHMRDSVPKPWHGPEPSIADSIVLVSVLLLLFFI